MKKFISSAAALALAAGLLLPFSAFADTTGGGTVTADLLNLRTEADISSESKLVIPYGAFVLIEGASDNWYKVIYNGVEGYVSGDYITFSETLDAAASATGTVLGSDVRLRAAPDGTVIGWCQTGDSVSVSGVSGEWLKVTTASGAQGYISSRYVSISPQTLSVTQAVSTAMQYLGCSYCWGGTSPTTGFDCSGFVYYIYSEIYGQELSRTAQGMYDDNGVSVAKDELKAGDLVFFGYSTSSITHVGIYIGDNKFIHSSTEDKGVIISELNSDYYTSMYVGAKRLVEA
ncbi:MAG: C40 family peptidase [Oscillospiraceae bacterium]|nr:C40 family peptidase [Oscillospiraceae bacterium]